MTQTHRLDSAIIFLSISLIFVSSAAHSQQSDPRSIAIGENDFGGVVRSAQGPEAGVWVIAETFDLPTRFAKIVVTDDQGRYVLPDLPKANYNVWVRGYGLVDSPKVQSAPGKILNLTAIVAPSDAAAAEYYPAIYWLSMLHIPPKNDFPAVPGGSMPPAMKTQANWLAGIKTDGCIECHQLGNKATRTIEPDLGAFANSTEAWTRRIQSGQASPNMVRYLSKVDVPRALRLFADWTDRIAAGELPFAKPKRPEGVERNLVVSVWDWSGPQIKSVRTDGVILREVA